MVFLDIDECLTNNGGCAHSCINNVGSFTCQCRPGHVLDYNGKTCSGTFLFDNNKQIKEHIGRMPFGFSGTIAIVHVNNILRSNAKRQERKK